MTEAFLVSYRNREELHMLKEDWQKNRQTKIIQKRMQSWKLKKVSNNENNDKLKQNPLTTLREKSGGDNGK